MNTISTGRLCLCLFYEKFLFYNTDDPREGWRVGGFKILRGNDLDEFNGTCSKLSIKYIIFKRLYCFIHY